MVVGRRGWHPGFMGPVASRLMERYARPAIAVALGGRTGVGSARAPALFNLVEALQACHRRLIAYGGHPQACGLTIRAVDLDRFREELNRHAQRSGARQRLGNTRVIDAEARLTHCTPSVAHTMGRFKPFGPGNPKPTVLLRGVRVEVDGEGRAWLTDQGSRARLRGRAAGLRSDERYDVVVSPLWLAGDRALTLCDMRLTSPASV